MGDSNDPNAWAGLLKWSLSHHDGTAPSEARDMSDEDRQWLERVVKEGVRDDVKTMAEIYHRLCAYLDLVATSSATSRTPSTSTAPLSSQELSQSAAPGGGATGRAAGEPNVVVGDHPAAGSTTGGSAQALITSAVAAPLATLSTFVAQPAGAASTVAASQGHDASRNEGSEARGEDKLEEVMDDLEELQDIVEQIDMAETFAKIGGFGRLIALAAPAYRQEKLRRRAASVIATLTKNNPPAQAAFSGSGGQKAFLEASAFSVEQGDDLQPSPAVRLAFLHALSCSVMGKSASEDALCAEPGFQELLRRSLAQDGESTENDDNYHDNAGAATMRAKLRSKAAFVLKALVGAPGASATRIESLWPAVVGLLDGLEAVAASGPGDDPAVARETCIESLLAASRSAGGERVIAEIGGRVASIMARRRQLLLEEEQLPAAARDQEDRESAAVELGLWMEWERLSGPPQ